MPLYDYRCKQCGEKFEVRQKFADEPLAIHEKCGGPVERLISTSALLFKGTGWYVTDYAQNGKTKQPQTGASPNKESKDSSSKESSSKDSSSKDPKAPVNSESKPAPAKSE